MESIAYLIVPCIVLGLLGVLLWGLQRDPHEVQIVEAEREITSDDPVAPAAVDPPLRHLNTNVLHDRRLLCSLFGPDTPDLVMALWTGDDDEAPATASFRQLFLPASNGMEAFARSLEDEFFEGVTDQGVEDRSRLLVAYTFSWLPGRGQDLVVESRFSGEGFRHQFYVSDSDGKMLRLRLTEESMPEVLHGEEWLAYRHLVESIRTGGAHEDLLHAFDEWTRHEVARPNAHAWTAHLGSQLGWRTGEVTRRLALCAEWQPLHLIGRIIRARVRDGSSEMQTVVSGLKDLVAQSSDREAQSLFLVSQALSALDQKLAAKRLCEAMLVDWPRHPGATGLLRQIDQHGRGAQT